MSDKVIWAGFESLFRKECMRFFRVAGQTILNPVINASLYLLIFGVNLADRISEQNGVNYLQFIIPGLIAMGALNNAFQNASSSIIISKFHGDLQDLKTAPLTPGQIIWAYGLGAAARGGIVGTVIGCVGEVFYWSQYGEWLPIDNILMLLAFTVVGSVIFGFLGLSVAVYAKNFDQVNAVGSFVLLPLIYLGGVFFSIATMHPFWKTASYANPLLYLINGIRYSFLGVSDIDPLTSAALAFGFLVVTFSMARYAVVHGSYTRF